MRLSSQPRKPAKSRRAAAFAVQLRWLLGLTAAVALLFGMLRWLEVSTTASVVVLVILIAAGIAAVDAPGGDCRGRGEVSRAALTVRIEWVRCPPIVLPSP